jgi:hypothetical protein
LRFSVTVVDGALGQGQSVLVDAEPDHTIADLLPQLVSTNGGAGMHPTFAARVGVWVDGRAVDRLATLREVDLRPGSVLALHEPNGNRPGLPGGSPRSGWWPGPEPAGCTGSGWARPSSAVAHPACRCPTCCFPRTR